ncbi:nuclear transport factor 2 family protein [Tenacibaculum amylolyticum]|uniref:nuclear transport factor 2 family protein n=1 Tax=Tenacibaculum amylolyticum TaxID=104269 RepID=UPI0038939A81
MESITIIKSLFENFSQGNLEGIRNLWDENAVIEFPFAKAPEHKGEVGSVTAMMIAYSDVVDSRIEGKDNIMAFWKASVAGTNGGVMHYDFIESMQDNEWCVVRGRGEFKTVDGHDYNNEYCFMVQVRNGKILHFYEYSNPLVTLASFEIV